MNTLLLLVLLTLGTLGLFYVAGAGVLRVAGLVVNGYFGLFLRMMVGMVMVVSAYAIVSTKGNSIMWLLLLVMSMIIWQLRAPSHPLTTEPFLPLSQELLVVAAAGLLIVLVRLPLLYNWHTGQIGLPYYDFIFYSRLIYPLNELGVESSFFDPINSQISTPNPYHFLEPWLNAMLVRTTGFVSAETLYICTYSVLITLLYLGYCAVFSHFGHSRSLTIIAALVCLPLTGLFIPLFNKFAMLSNVYFDMSNFLMVFPKLTSVTTFILLSYLLHLKDRPKAAVWALAAIPVIFISTAPSIAFGVGLWACYRAWRMRAPKPLTAVFRTVWPVAATLAAFVSFYGLNTLLHQSGSQNYPRDSQQFLAAPSYWLHAPAFLTGLALAVVAYYCLYAFLVGKKL